MRLYHSRRELPDDAPRPLWVRSRHNRLLDQLVGAGEHRGWNSKV